MTRTWLHILEHDSEFLEYEQNIATVVEPTHTNGNLWFSTVFPCFSMLSLDDGLAVPLGPLWFLLPLQKFLVQRGLHCHQHCRWFHCQLFGHERMGTETRGACGNQTVVLHHRHVPGG